MSIFFNGRDNQSTDDTHIKRGFFTFWFHFGIALKQGILLAIFITILLTGTSFTLSLYLSKQLQNDALEVMTTNNRIFHNNISTEYKRVLRDAEHYCNVYINNYQNVTSVPLHTMEAEQLKSVLGNALVNKKFTDFTGVLATTFLRKGDKFIRVSTSLQEKNGKIATETALSPSSPALPALLKNKSYSGVVTLFGNQFIAYYEPIADKYGQVVGAVAIGFDVQVALQPVIKELTEVHIGNGGYAYVMDAGINPGKMIAHPTLVNQQVQDITDVHGFKRFSNILERKKGIVYYETTNGYDSFSRKKVAVFEYVDGINWIIATTGDIDNVDQSSNLVRNSLLLFSAILIPVILLIIAFSSRILISNRLKKALKISSSIARGDLTVDIRVDYNDEIGEILGANEKMRASLHSLVEEVVYHAQDVQQAALNITEEVQGQASNSVETSSSVAEITSTMEELSASSAQIAEYSRSVVDIADLTLINCNNGSESMEVLKKQMSSIDSDNQKNMREIMKLGDNSKEISQVMIMINNIADQTKVIAFNAALEASSAGESGKRFSVVASEIRRLADSVTSSTFEIEKKISAIQNSIAHLVLNAEKGNNNIKAATKACDISAERLYGIITSAKQTTTAATQIALSTQQQKTASNQVVMALREIVAASHHTSQSMKDILSISQDMEMLANGLNQAVHSFKLKDELNTAVLPVS